MPPASRQKAVIALSVAAFALGAASCGSDDDNGAASADRTTADADTATEPRSDRGQISQLLRDAQQDFNAGDGPAFCDRLTAPARAEVIDFAQNVGQGSDCPSFVRTSSRRARESGLKQRPTRLVSVRIQGNRANAIVQDGERAPQPKRFWRIDGEWKIRDSGFKDIF